MKITVALLIALVVCVPLILLFLRSRKGLAAQREEMLISTATESSARAAALLPTVGSEDRSDLLKVAGLPPAPPSTENYQPDPKVDWSVKATFPEGTILEKAVLLGGFDKKWLQKHGRPEIYGQAATDGHWTFVQAGDAPDFYTELAFAWRLVDDSEETSQPISATDLASHLSALRNRLSVLGEPDLKPSATPEAAVQTARGLIELKTTCDRQAAIVLRATPNSPFDGQKIWDVMMSLGLKWGDMDIFHWVNSSDSGDDSFFSVWTSTPPGYFLPEHIAAGRVQTADLVFGFSIPRCAAPQSVFSSMVKAAEYAKQRLGGELLDGDRRPLDVAGQQKEISAIEERLKAAGFQPGLQSALHIF